MESRRRHQGQSPWRFHCLGPASERRFLIHRCLHRTRPAARGLRSQVAGPIITLPGLSALRINVRLELGQQRRPPDVRLTLPLFSSMPWNPPLSTTSVPSSASLDPSSDSKKNLDLGSKALGEWKRYNGPIWLCLEPLLGTVLKASFVWGQGG